jgi:malate synthase
MKLASGIVVDSAPEPALQGLLVPGLLEFLARLHRRFEPQRQALLRRRAERALRIDAGERLDFPAASADLRAATWTIAPQPADLRCRRVEITGPTERKMMINAFNSGADTYMADFEDSNAPSWRNLLEGQRNLFDAVRRRIAHASADGRRYQLNERVATLIVRPRGWHLDEGHVRIDGQPMSGALFDFAVFLFHNGAELVARGSGPYFYLPKLESRDEARLWNDVFVAAQRELGIARGTIKATVLIETLPAAFEMDEILYELREHSAGLNAGRWDYIFSCIKTFRADPQFCLADRARLTMLAPFLRAYALRLIAICHRRGAPAIGGMSALIPARNDAAANDRALEGVRADKTREATDGYDGAWVAHPALVPVAMAAFVAVLGDRPNQFERQRDDVVVSAQDLLAFNPEGPITEAGVRMNLQVCIHYLGAWLEGNGCVPIHNLMEDAATAEISRAQVWQWIRSPKGVLEDGRKINAELVRAWIPQELAKVKQTVGSDRPRFDEAARIVEAMTTARELADFLTLPLYAQMIQEEAASRSGAPGSAAGRETAAESDSDGASKRIVNA